MGKIKFGAMMVDGRGKLGGHVYTKSRSGSTIRTKVTPSNGRTVAQQNFRSSLTSLTQGWRALTQTQIAAWNAAVANFRRTDIFGSIKTPSGINLYVELNQNLKQVNVSAISTPPLPASVTAILTLSGTAAAGSPAMSITFTPTPVPANTAYIFRATRQLSAGVSFTKGMYRNIAVVDAAGTSPLNALSAYTAKFGTLIAGKKIGIEMVAISKTTGIKGIPLTATITVAA